MEPWKALAQEDYEVHYIVLRASKKETMKRAVERSKLDRKTNIELVETMWEQFSGLGIYESNVIDTTTFTIKDTVSDNKRKSCMWDVFTILDIPICQEDSKASRASQRSR